MYNSSLCEYCAQIPFDLESLCSLWWKAKDEFYLGIASLIKSSPFQSCNLVWHAYYENDGQLPYVDLNISVIWVI